MCFKHRTSFFIVTTRPDGARLQVIGNRTTMTDYSTTGRGEGGETHQVADADHPVLTTNHGTPISDNQNQLKAGARGPVLLKEGAAVQWVMDAFGHLKAIGHNAAAKPLLDKAGVEADAGVTDLGGFVEAAKKRYWDREAKVRALA